MIIDEIFEAPQPCPECGGISFSDLILAEKKDACYYKVKASAKVWPSAYASGRLVQCRKKGAGNYGNKSESMLEGSNESYIIIRTDKEGKQDVFAKFDTYEKAQKELDACLAHPLHTKYKQKFELKRKGQQGQQGQQGVAEGNLKEFAQVGGDDREPDEEEILRKLAAQWWNGTEQQMAKAQNTLAAMGWEIGQDESGDDDAGVFVIRAGDVNGNSYIAFNHSDLDLNEGVAEGVRDLGYDAQSLITKLRRDVEEKRLQPTRQAVLMAARELAGDMDFAPELLVQQVLGRGMAEGQPKEKEANYGADYQDMVARVKHLAGLGPLKTVWDPQKRVYKNVPVAVQPKK
jgi:hypothetical protein